MATNNPKRILFTKEDLPKYALIIIGSYLFYLYLDKFFTLSADIIGEIGVSVVTPLGIQINNSYYPLDFTFKVVGGIFLLLFILATNEHRNLLSSPSDWRGYPTIIVGLIGFLFLLLIVEAVEITPSIQKWLFLFGVITSCTILIFDDCQEIIETIVAISKSPLDCISIIRQNWKGYIATLVVVSIYLTTLLIPIFLPAFSYSFYELISRTILFACLLTLFMGLYSSWDLSLERSKPSTQDKKFSATIFMFAAPFILFLVLRVMYLIKTDQNWALSYDFMEDIGGFPLNNWPWQINPTEDSRWTFYRAGIINSVRATLVAIVLCTLLGIFVGVTRLSNNKLASGLATGYVEFFRNIPLAILLFFVAVQLREALPAFGDEFFVLDLFYISKQGHWIPGIDTVNTVISLCILMSARIYTWYADRDGVDDSNEGVIRRISFWGLAILVSAAVFFTGDFSVPELVKPNETSTGMWYIEGGTGFKITSPFVALVLSLTLFTASIVAEIVRGSIQSLPRGQVEAAISLGLSPFQRLRLVILPQALRSMVPLLNSQYMNVWKNSSLAIIVAYSDIFYITLVMMNNVGKLIPLFILLLVIYQIGSLTISVIMNIYNARVTKVKI